MKAVKCDNCGKILYEADIKEGTVKKKCPRCGHVNVQTAPFQDRIPIIKK